MPALLDRRQMTAREPYRGSGAADRRGLLRGLLLVYLTFWVDTGAVAQNGVADLPSEPILRIETGQHDAIIERIDTDVANRFAVTASLDKTVRVWALSD